MKQQLLAVSYGDKLYKCRLNPSERPVVTIGNEWSHTITNPDLEESLTMNWDLEKSVWKIEDRTIHVNKENRIELKNHKSFHMWITYVEEAAVYDIATKYSIALSEREGDDITIDGTGADLVFIRDSLDEPFKVNVYEGRVFHNHQKLEGSAILESGDQLFFDGVTIQIGHEDIQLVAAKDKVQSTLPRLLEADSYLRDEYPDYHRSPRIIYREPVDKMTIAKPTSEPSKPTEHLIRMIAPSLVMIVVTVLLAIFMSNGLYILASLAMTLATVIISVTSYIKSVKQYKIDIAERDKSYREYLKQKTKDLYEETEKQRHALHYHYPDVAEIRNMAMQVNSRIYEKTMLHHDFLTYRVGTGQENTSFEIQFNEEEFSQKKDELIEAARELRQQYLSLQDVPVVTDLMNGPVGYIGQRSLVLEQLQLLVMQTSLFHSYYDLQFITLFPEEEKKKWDWMRWLPHASVRDINVRGFVYHERSRDQVLNSLYQILKDRKMKIEEKGSSHEKLYFAPHYVVLITDEKLILDHIVMEFFNEDPTELGVSLVFVQDVMQSLPEHVKTVIDIRDSKKGNMILEKGELVNRQFALDHFPKDFNLEDVSRALAPLNHLQNLKNSIPESVTFLEMYGVEKIQELNITARWEKNAAHKSLAVPLGLRGKEDIVNLNLHEKAHGPHGLVAGTTGSGKSEIIQSYILSLAVNFHPYEVAFLLIDYKGGGMANLFKDLPHLLGTITNLDGAQSMRALASIKAELQKRQRLFGEHDVNHINQYQKLYKQGKAKEPMPHLFLISDEFAELKAEQPDFMKELVSTARIGRSLGIHLILATQKPSGVVDDQIWSNSKFKLALKVQNTSDSNEILKTPDAAEITLPGRAYLQVGNNEIYELFQSAWSGADYIENKDDQEHLDATIYAINDLGQYEILSDDLSGLGKQESIAKVPTELDAVIDYIHEYTEEERIAPLKRPWLPPLEERIYLPQLQFVDSQQAWQEPKSNLEPMIGIVDIPEMQAQEPLQLNLTKEGHIVVFASPGYGKSSFLQSVVMDLARKHSPEHLHVYLLDFGTNGLLSLKGLPHVADTFMTDDLEKINKFIRRLSKELKDRKQLLSKYGVANMEMYEKASGKSLPNILITLDNYDTVRDGQFGDEFERMITQIAREGASIGIHLLMSAGRQNAILMSLLANIKMQIALYNIEQNEARNIVGRTDLTIEELPGRGLVKLENPAVFQTALPTIGEDALAIVEAIQEEVKAMNHAWKGERPLPIPMVPEVLHYKEFIVWPQTKQLIENKQIPFAVDMEEVQPVVFDLEKHQNIVVIGDQLEIIENSMEMILQLLKRSDAYDIVLFDNSTMRFTGSKEVAAQYVSNGTEMEEVAVALRNVWKRREEAFIEMQKESNGQLSIHEFKKQLRPIVVVITDVPFINSTMNTTVEDNLGELIENGHRMGIHCIISGTNGLLGKDYDRVNQAVKKQKTGIVLTKVTDQWLFEVSNRPYKEKNLQPYEAYFIQQNMAEKIKLAAYLSPVENLR
ncbi:type VII secretion protein EssC [Bacillus rhizoplanae]|uniref:type VII secretion protein EssC n=1 Tax=Bacillus rhizoplanae TaxID=2880966 RepID=UPI003D22EDCA